MRFSLAKLMLLPVAFGLAFLIPTPGNTARGIGRIDFTFCDLTNLRTAFESIARKQGERAFDAAAMNAWLAGQPVTSRDIEILRGHNDGWTPEPDAWGQPYRFVQTVDGETGAITRQGIYSCGRDKVSQSVGSDPDDLNTWSNDWEDFYDYHGKRQKERDRLSAAVIFTPFVFLALLGLGKLWRLTALPERR